MQTLLLQHSKEYLIDNTSNLLKGQTETEREFARLAAVRSANHKVSPVGKAQKLPPMHIQALLDLRKKAPEPPASPSKAKGSTNVAILPPGSLQADPMRSLVAADFNAEGKLELIFDDGKKILTKNTGATEVIRSAVVLASTSPVGLLQFDTQVNKPPHTEGLLFWDKENHSLSYYNDEPDVTLNLGQEELVRVYNGNSHTILNTQLVYINGANTGWPTVSLARANSLVDSQAIIGMVTANIEPSSYGYVCVSGTVHGVNTSQYTAGSTLYLSEITAGSYTDIAPIQPNYSVEIGTVLFPDVNGKVFIRVDKKQWFPSIEIIDSRSSVVLPTVPTVFKPTIVEYNNGFTYDSATGILTVLNNAAYTMALTFNATPSASNKNIYFYIEERINSVWTIKRYSARKSKLDNQAEIQVNIASTKYYVKDTQIRFNIWSDATVSLNTTDLPGTAVGTVSVPAYRFMMAG